LTRGDGTRVARYLPLGVRDEARQYVDHAVRGGGSRARPSRSRDCSTSFPLPTRNRRRTASSGSARASRTRRSHSFPAGPPPRRRPPGSRLGPRSPSSAASWFSTGCPWRSVARRGACRA
jgi:hypothetical protein